MIFSLNSFKMSYGGLFFILKCPFFGEYFISEANVSIKEINKKIKEILNGKCCRKKLGMKFCRKKLEN